MLLFEKSVELFLTAKHILEPYWITTQVPSQTPRKGKLCIEISFSLEMISCYPERPPKFISSSLQQILLWASHSRFVAPCLDLCQHSVSLTYIFFQRCLTLTFKSNLHTCKSLSFLQSVLRILVLGGTSVHCNGALQANSKRQNIYMSQTVTD